MSSMLSSHGRNAVVQQQECPGVGWVAYSQPQPLSGFHQICQTWYRNGQSYEFGHLANLDSYLYLSGSHSSTYLAEILRATQVTDEDLLRRRSGISRHGSSPSEIHIRAQWDDDQLARFDALLYRDPFDFENSWLDWLMVHPTENKRRERNTFQASQFWRWNPTGRGELPDVLVTCIGVFYTRGISHRMPTRRCLHNSMTKHDIRINMKYSGVYTDGDVWVRGCYARFKAPHGGPVNMKHGQLVSHPILLSDDHDLHVCDDGMDGIVKKLKDPRHTFYTVSAFKAWIIEYGNRDLSDINQLGVNIDWLFTGAPNPAIFVELKSNTDGGVYFCNNMAAAISEISYVDKVAQANNVTYEWV